MATPPNPEAAAEGDAGADGELDAGNADAAPEELEDLPEQDVGEWAAYRLHPTPRREEARQDPPRRDCATALRELAQNDELDARLVRVALPGARRADVGQQCQERLDGACSRARGSRR